MKINPNDIELNESRRTQRKHASIRGEYFRDQTAIIHSMAFRRLKHKTQVFFAPSNDHVCTRIEHVLHVATIAATICKGLNKAGTGWDLDIDLAYTIGLGHDIGHAPFGHAGEEALSEKRKSKFMHEINGLRIVDKIAKDGLGLNLTYAVRDGIVCHNGENFEQEISPEKRDTDPSLIVDKSHNPTTYEGCIVRFADKIAYLGRDIEDALTAGIITKKDEGFPQILTNELGNLNGEIIDFLIKDIITTSKNIESIKFSDEKHSLMKELKKYNYSKIYNNDDIKHYKKYGKNIIYELFDYLSDLFDRCCGLEVDVEKYKTSKVPLKQHFAYYLRIMKKIYINENTSKEDIITDYISGMTDNYALDCMRQIIIPEPLSLTSNYLNRIKD